MNKKALCGILSTAILFGACPMTALAEERLNTLDTNIMDFRNATEDREGDGWYWDADDLTLTLENFYYEVPEGKLEEKAAIYLPDEAEVEIEGKENVLNIYSYHCDAFYCEGEVNFYGDGELEIMLDSSGADAIFVKKGPLLIDDEVEITVESRGYVIYLEEAKGDKPLISIQDEAKLIFNKEDHEKRNILLVKKSGVATSYNWFDYAEVDDEWDDEYINLVAKSTVKTEKPEKEEKPATPPAEETPADEPVKQSEYQIVIGNSAIKKDGAVTYISDAKPYLSHGYTMLPLRALLNVTGANVDIAWDAVTKTITVTEKSDSQDVNKVTIVIGEKQMKHGTESINLYTPAELGKARAFVSLRDWMNILSALNMPASDLNWDAKTKTVTFMK